MKIIKRIAATLYKIFIYAFIYVSMFFILSLATFFTAISIEAGRPIWTGGEGCIVSLALLALFLFIFAHYKVRNGEGTRRARRATLEAFGLLPTAVGWICLFTPFNRWHIEGMAPLAEIIHWIILAALLLTPIIYSVIWVVRLAKSKRAPQPDDFS